MNKRKIGAVYEKEAAVFLKQKGYDIIQMNYRCRLGEIDLIAKDGEYLVFVEVKYRKDEQSGNPLEAVDYKKQRMICKVATYYLMKHGFSTEQPCRFDVVGIVGTEVTLIKNAFEYRG